MKMRLNGRVAVVTGGAQGIGAATAAVFAEEGARVMVGDLLEHEGEGTVAAIRAAGGEAHFMRTDVTIEEDCAQLIDATVQRYGRLDALVCCAGILRGSWSPVEELDEATFRAVIDVNLIGTYLCVRHAAPHLQQAGNGVVLLLASGAGVRGPSSSFAYGASKGGVHGLAMTLEARLAPLGIRVNDVCPAVIDTAMMRGVVAAGARAAGRPEEEALASVSFGDPRGVARVLAFLASSDAEYVRGTVFTR
jgi:NAD(P)-dependent dehydrogenase (short-subunit alcohol dehydrogenase family)